MAITAQRFPLIVNNRTWVWIMKTKIIIATAAFIIAAFEVRLFISLGKKSDKAFSSEKGQQELSASPTNLLCPEASSTAFANNFVYYKTYDGIAE